MPHPVVLRITKLSKIGNVAASGAHNWRERKTPNANPDLTPSNIDLRPVVGAAALVEAVKARVVLAEEAAPDAVPCIEYLVTANADAFTENGGTVDGSAYLRDALAWIEAKHGAENVVAASIHMDEEAPHLVAYVVPLVQHDAKMRKRSVIAGTNADGTKRRETREFAMPGKLALSAAHYLDGRDKLSRMQTEFAQAVGQKYGLERGIEGSKARHTTIKAYYARANAAFEPLPEVKTAWPELRAEPAKPGLFAGSEAKADHDAWLLEKERAEQVAKRYRAEVKAQRDAAVATARRHQAQASEAQALKRTVVKLKKSNSYYVKKSIELEGQVEKLSKVAALFTPAELSTARERKRQQDAEKVREAVEAARQASVAAEVRRRVAAIPELLRRAAGAARTFAVKASEALRAVGNAKVNWGAVEAETVAESIAKNGQSPESVVEALTSHSPGRADPASHQEVRRVVQKLAPELEAEYKQRQQRSGPKMTP